MYGRSPGPDARNAARVETSTLVISTWRRPEVLRHALAGVAAQTRRFDEVLVTVRPEDTASREVIAAADGVALREILVDRPGLVAARNAALDAATGDICVFLDDDAVPPPDWHAKLVPHFETDPKIAAVGGRDRIHRDGRVVVGYRKKVGMLLPYGRCIGLHHLGAGEPRDVDFLKGVNMSIRRQALPALRCDETLRGQGAQRHEDTALSFAVKEAGFRVVYDPGIWVDHFESQRVEGDLRSDASGPAVFDRAFNQTYAVVRYLPARRAVIHVIYSVAVGSKREPGVTALGYRLLQGDGRRAVSALLYALRGRSDAVRYAWRGRHDRHPAQ
jgi:GT2 family glycosyltransferase